MSALFNLSDLSPMQIGRVNAALDKRFNFSEFGVATLRAFIEAHAPVARKFIGDHSFEYSRTRFNRMNGAEQAAYEKRLARASYNFQFKDGISIGIPKIVFDVLNIPLRLSDWS
jgi:hypothetical protein